MSDVPLSPDRTAEPPACGERLAWSFMAAAQIGNFTILRRRLGRRRAGQIIGEVAARVVALLPAATVSIVGSDRLDIAFDGAVPSVLHESLAAVERACAAPFAIDGEDHHVALSIGAAIAATGQGDEVGLIEEAERAIEAARIEGAPVVRALTPGPSVDRLALKRDLAEAIAGDQLLLHYQPKLHLRRQEVTGVEALIRWQHPTRGLVMPGDFIPIAEESRDIVGLTLWTLRRVIADQRIMAQAGHDLIVFINVAGVLLGDERFVREVCALVPASGARIGFEITETSVIRDPESAIAHLKIFDSLGIVLAIDDYGAGLSSLAYLKQLPARELKIDKLFITDLTRSHRDPLIVRSTIDLAHALDMEVVAEGVETEAALALLSVMGCDMAQGYLISRPIGLNTLLLFLENYRTGSVPFTTSPPLAGLAARWQRT